MHVAALTGSSGAGKTTLVVALIEHYRAAGLRVGAIKHTHHPLNEENRGDTARFRAAGAEPVILARTSEAVVFRANGTERISFAHPRELLAQFGAHDVVLVEGFRDLHDWPRVAISAEARPALAELVATLGKIWRS